MLGRWMGFFREKAAHGNVPGLADLLLRFVWVWICDE
jgi:hypothetical protein